MEGIHQNVYFYWQRKLRKTACASLTNIPATENALAPNGWKQLSVEVNTESTLIIEVGGCRITVSSEADPELLIKVCRTLRTL